MLPIRYTPEFIPNPSEVLESLKIDLEWEKRDDAPRHEYYCNDFPNPYVYGAGRGRRIYYPRPYHPHILAIRKSIEAVTSTVFEVCFLNRYTDQSDHLGWHADDSPEMDDLRPIAVVSLGVEREIWFRPKPESSNDYRPSPPTDKLKLGSGSLCLMLPGMQDAWQHRIPKASFICGERVSLTFRGYVPP